jgi:hypothetical protein
VVVEAYACIHAGGRVICADTRETVVAIANEDGVPLGKVLQDPLDALMGKRKAAG